MSFASIAAFVVGYALGSIPFGLLLTRFAGMQDIRKIGSGNIGATNVLRTGHKGLAAATLICDLLKGTAAVLIAYAIWQPEPALFAALGAFVGHVFPVWLSFKGGKGVATYIGVFLALAWPSALVFGAVWLVVAAITRYSSLSGLIASLATLLFIVSRGDRAMTVLCLVLTVALWITHRVNIARLINGTEGKIGKSDSPAPSA
jgi:acyl phosphate:glycerol-3-phosphate acyltransferase